MSAYHPKKTLESFPKYKNPDHPKATGDSALIALQQWELDEQSLFVVQAASHTHESARQRLVQFRL